MLWPHCTPNALSLMVCNQKSFIFTKMISQNRCTLHSGWWSTCFQRVRIPKNNPGPKIEVSIPKKKKRKQRIQIRSVRDTWPCATLDRSRALTNDCRVQHRAIQNMPYLDKFETPEALDRCIRILSARSSFLAWFWGISAKSFDIDRLHRRIAWYWRAAPQNHRNWRSARRRFKELLYLPENEPFLQRILSSN